MKPPPPDFGKKTIVKGIADEHFKNKKQKELTKTLGNRSVKQANRSNLRIDFRNPNNSWNVSKIPRRVLPTKSRDGYINNNAHIVTTNTISSHRNVQKNREISRYSNTKDLKRSRDATVNKYRHSGSGKKEDNWRERAGRDHGPGGSRYSDDEEKYEWSFRDYY